MKKLLLFLFFLVSLISCTDEHVCSYDSLSQKCNCGKINPAVVAYIGSSNEDAGFRFLSLQAAQDFVKTSQTDSSNPKIVIKGCSDAVINLRELKIENSNVEFDLSQSKVNTSSSSRIITSSSDVTIKVDGDLNFGLIMDKSSIAISSDSVFINDVSVDASSVVALATDEVKVQTVDFAKILRDVLSESTTAEIQVQGHECAFDSVTQECECGRLNRAVVAFIGTSNEDASARFTNLQSATDYVNSIQTGKTSPKVTVTACTDAEISLSELEVVNSNIEFDLSECNLTSDSSVKIATSFSNVTFKTKADLNCGITMNNSSLVVEALNLEIKDFSSDEESLLTLNATGLLKAGNLETLVAMRKVLAKPDNLQFQLENHTEHTFDSVSQMCPCGELNSAIIAFIGTSKNEASARFTNLQSATDYVTSIQTGKTATKVTIKGCSNTEIACSELKINNINVEYDLSSNTLKADSVVEILTSSSNVLFKVNGNLNCDIAIEESSLQIEADSLDIRTFDSDEDSSLVLNVTGAVKAQSLALVKDLRKVLDPQNLDVQIEGHVHDFDSVSQVCECGKLNDEAVVFIGATYSEASARFINLQSATDYVQATQTGKNDEKITVKGLSNKEINLEELKIENCNIEFDLSSTTIKTGSSVVILTSSSNVVIKPKGTLGWKLVLNDSSLNLVCESLLISDFDSDDGSSLTLTTSGTIKVQSCAVAKKIREAFPDYCTVAFKIDGHTHSLKYKMDGDEIYYWQECEDCKYCTAKKNCVTKWVSVFYLDMANLDPLTDLEEIVSYIPSPENVTTYIITGGGKNYGLLQNRMYYDPYYLNSYPNLAKALEYGGDKRHTASFNTSTKANSYQYWKYYLDSNGKGAFVEIKRPQTRLMSDGFVLKDFIDYVYSVEDKPKTRYFLHLWNHGGGNMWGMMQDLTVSSYPIMSMKDMDDSVSATSFVTKGNKFDIILFDMCNMQQIETLNMVKDYAKCMVGSENTTYASCLGSIYKYMNEYPSASYQDTVTYFINKTYDKQTTSFYYSKTTWSAVDLEKATEINDLNSAFNDFLSYAVSAKSTFETALYNSVDYSSGSKHDTCSYDICDVAREFGYIGCPTLEAAVSKIVIHNKYGSGVPGSCGLAFFFDPDLSSNISVYGLANYNDYIERANALYPNLATLTTMFLQ